MCSDARGLYRADMAGTDSGGRWQLLTDGRWLLVQQ
jgi:hypothetical protein